MLLEKVWKRLGRLPWASPVAALLWPAQPQRAAVHPTLSSSLPRDAISHCLVALGFLTLLEERVWASGGVRYIF